ncbi:MAG TPA: hypothetical protein VMS88_00625 [Terriglobales bacterium]|nr:hypothetical protein [Terriglobales bacterium]
MSVVDWSLLTIAIVNVILVAAVIVVVARLVGLLSSAQRVLRDQGVPLLERANRIAEDFTQVSGNVREVGGRVTGTAARVMEQVEPPIRHLTALVAGIRAGVGWMFEPGHHRNGERPRRASGERTMR